MRELVGWVDFQRDLGNAGTVVADLIAGFGVPSDGNRIRAERHAVLGLRASAGEPLGLAADASTAIVFAGECHNRREIAAAGSDAEAVLTAYARWGESLPEHLDGDYAFALWDARQNRLLLVRDRLGALPLYYCPLGDGVLFASRPGAILAHPSVKARLSADGLRTILSGITVPGQTPFDGIHLVRAGHVVTFTPDGENERKYWGLRISEHTDDQDTTVRRTRELVADAVRRRVDRPARISPLLSGGVDSSTITALYAREHDAAVRTFSVDYQGYEQDYQPHIARPAPDSPFVRDMVAHLGTAHTDVVLEAADLTTPGLWDSLVDVLDQPAVLAEAEPSMYLLFQEIKGQADVVLGGQGADELFGGFPWFHPQWAQAPDFPWAVTTDMLIGKLFRPGFDTYEVYDYRADRYREALADLPEIAGEEAVRRRMREVVYLFVTHFLPEEIDRAYRLGAAVDVDVRFPFCDRRLAEYVFNIPWGMHTFDGFEKAVLRTAVTDLLPRSVLERRKSGYPMIRDTAYDQGLRAQVGALAVRDDAPIRPLLDDELLRAAHEGRSDVTFSRNELELALKLNGWLARHQLDLP